MSIEIKTVNCGDLSLKYFSFGNGSKVMVILPGLSVQSVMGSAAAIRSQYKIFKDDYTVYVLDRRENPPADYSMEDMARDTACALKELGLRDIYIFGASQGGMLAMLIAIEILILITLLKIPHQASIMIIIIIIMITYLLLRIVLKIKIVII